MASEKEIEMFYKLSQNESLHSVAKKFNISPQILSFKNVDINFKAGTTIAIPIFSGDFYKVQIGDTIEGICDRFKIEKSQFVEKNGVNFIYHGMIVSV